MKAEELRRLGVHWSPKTKEERAKQLKVSVFLRKSLPQKIVNRVRSIFAIELSSHKEKSAGVIYYQKSTTGLKVVYFDSDEPMMEAVLTDMKDSIGTIIQNEIRDAKYFLENLDEIPELFMPISSGKGESTKVEQNAERAEQADEADE